MSKPETRTQKSGSAIKQDTSLSLDQKRSEETRHPSEPLIEPKGKEFWGNPLWTTLHILGATFHPSRATAFKTFLTTLAQLLPCEACKGNLIKKMKMYPPEPYLTNNHDAFFYTYLLHDMVNQNLTELDPKNPKVSPDYDEVKTYYFRALSQECNECSFGI